MKIADITKIIEGTLFVAGEGVDKDEFKRIYDLSDKELNKCLDALKEKYNDDSGINIISYKNKIQLCSNPKYADNIAEILNPIRERSLTKAALETVAIVAYKQPITRTEIEQIRGVNCDYAVQLLQNNNLIEVVGRKDAVGKPLLFGTTENFLKRFELTSLDQLPNYNELLDRIRVIHSEGDSLYREFTIPDEAEEGEENAKNTNDNSAQTENTNLNNNLETEDIANFNKENIQNKESMQEVNVVNNNEDDLNIAKNIENNNQEKIAKKRRRGLINALEESGQVLSNDETDNDISVENKANENASVKMSWQERLKKRMAENSQEE